MDKELFKWTVTVLCWTAVIVTFLICAGCAHNPCIDNPRNMQCMTAEELEEALG